MESPAREGIDGFLADLADCGISAKLADGVVLYEVEPVDGARAGQLVATGLSASELSAWPAVPPHWVHFEQSLTIVPTNTDATDCLPGWVRHSRDLKNWSMSAHPGQAWIAHVRSILTNASAA